MPTPQGTHIDSRCDPTNTFENGTYASGGVPHIARRAGVDDAPAIAYSVTHSGVSRYAARRVSDKDGGFNWSSQRVCFGG